MLREHPERKNRVNERLPIFLNSAFAIPLMEAKNCIVGLTLHTVCVPPILVIHETS
jgi:hypothetical protein